MPSFTRRTRPSWIFSNREPLGTISAVPLSSCVSWSVRAGTPMAPDATSALPRDTQVTTRSASTGACPSRSTLGPAMSDRRRFPIIGSLTLLVAVTTACDLPSIERYDPLPLAQTSFLYAADGSLITQLHAAENRVVLREREMSPFVRDAAVAIE